MEKQNREKWQASLANSAFPFPGLRPVGLGSVCGFLIGVYISMDEQGLGYCNAPPSCASTHLGG